MRALVTGATGFIGARVVSSLADRGWKVSALVLPGDEAKLDARAFPISGDLHSKDDVDTAVSVVQPEAAVHVAWYAKPIDYVTSRENIRMLTASVRLAETLIDAGCKTLIGVGTAAEYDTKLPGPYAEDSELAPRSLYAACKAGTRDIWMELARLSGVRFAWARVFWLYGPREQPGRLVPEVLSALRRGERARVSMGEQIRDFMHVADVGDAIAHIAASPSIVGPINVGSGEPTPVRRVVATLASLLGKDDLVEYGAIPTRPGEPPTVVANVSKLHESGWRQRFDLESGLRNVVG